MDKYYFIRYIDNLGRICMGKATIDNEAKMIGGSEELKSVYQQIEITEEVFDTASLNTLSDLYPDNRIASVPQP